jgi:glycosyltransferase involved in cell wall biosynthesis
MTVRVLPTIRHKYLDTLVHTFFSAVDAMPRRFDIVLVCNNANAPFAILPRLTGARVVLNVDGLEWRRRKWGLPGRLYYQFCAALAPHLPVRLVSDARVIADYYAARGADTAFIPYGTNAVRIDPGETLARLGLTPNRYLLYVSRLEPENHALTVIEAYREAAVEVPLVVVGDAPYASTYKKQVQEAAAVVPGVVLTGYQFGAAYDELQSNARIYVQATEVGGTHPALVEAMGRGIAIIANDVPEHREVLGEAGVYYRRNNPTDLGERIRSLIHNDGELRSLGAAARNRALRVYSWESVAREYERLFASLVAPA